MRDPMFNGHVYALCLLSISKWKASKCLKMKWKAYPLPLLPFSIVLFPSYSVGSFNLQRLLFGLVPNAIHNSIFNSVDITFSMQGYSIFTWCHRIQHSVCGAYSLYWKILRFSYTDNVEKYSRQIANDVHRAHTSFLFLGNLFWLQYATLVHRVQYLLFAWCYTIEPSSFRLFSLSYGMLNRWLFTVHCSMVCQW